MLSKQKMSNKCIIDVQISEGNILSQSEPRPGWAEAAKMMNANDDDKCHIIDVPNDFEKTEWTW